MYIFSRKRLIPPSFDNSMGAEMQTLSTNKVPLQSEEAEYKIVPQINDVVPALIENEDELDTALNTALYSKRNSITIVVGEK